MKHTSVALSLAHAASAARPCAQGAVVVAFGDWSMNPMTTLKRNGYGDITARTRWPRRRPT